MRNRSWEMVPHWSYTTSCIVVRRGHREDETSGWPESWPQAIRGSSAPPPSLKCTFYPLFPQREPFSRTQSWESKVLLRPSGQYIWLNPVKVSIQTFKTLASGREDLLIVLPLPKTSIICKSPCFFNLPPSNLRWFTSFFGLSLPSVYRGQFQILPGKLPKFQANNCASF